MRDEDQIRPDPGLGTVDGLRSTAAPGHVRRSASRMAALGSTATVRSKYGASRAVVRPSPAPTSRNTRRRPSPSTRRTRRASMSSFSSVPARKSSNARR
nr:hypothetical protein [Streptomyces mobaraensis]